MVLRWSGLMAAGGLSSVYYCNCQHLWIRISKVPSPRISLFRFPTSGYVTALRCSGWMAVGVLRSGITPVLGLYGVEYQHPGGQVSP